MGREARFTMSNQQSQNSAGLHQKKRRNDEVFFELRSVCFPVCVFFWCREGVCLPQGVKIAPFLGDRVRMAVCMCVRAHTFVCMHH